MAQTKADTQITQDTVVVVDKQRSKSLSTLGNNTPTKSSKITLSKCPCMKSNEASWKLKCHSCKQIWHTSCANLKAKTIPETVILNLEKSWACPWCFITPHVRPAGHPGHVNERTLMGTVIADAVEERITEEINHNLIPQFQESVDNLVKIRIKEITKSMDAQVKQIENGRKDMEELKEKLLSLSRDSRLPTSQSLPEEEAEVPLAENPTEHIDGYIEQFLSEDQTNSLAGALEQLRYSPANGRQVATFGEEYQYVGAPKVNNKNIPDPLKNIMEMIHGNPSFQDAKINQVVVNRYSGNLHLPEHSDDEKSIRPHSHIFTVTVGSTVPLTFRNKISNEEKTFSPCGGSLYTMSMESQHYWSHRIEATNLDDQIRYSITFRSVGNNQKNSTIIMGDSNSKHLRFSSGQRGEKGTFGYALPGERLQTFHINDIDPLKCIGFRNVVIMCGINDIRDNSPGRKPTDPEPTDIGSHFEKLAQKVSAIKQMCPYASVFVCPLLPTKNERLNQRVLKFNQMLFDFLANDPRGKCVRSANFSEFVDHNQGTLREDLGVWDSNAGGYNKKDILHLGRTGIRLLAKIIRECVLMKSITSCSYRDTLTNQNRFGSSQIQV